MRLFGMQYIVDENTSHLHLDGIWSVVGCVLHSTNSYPYMQTIYIKIGNNKHFKFYLSSIHFSNCS